MKLSVFFLFLTVVHHSINTQSNVHAKHDSNKQINSKLNFENDRLKHAYEAFQAWKKLITEDPKNITSTWVGSDVCSYTGVFCAPLPDHPDTNVVAGIDLNHANIAGFLPIELGLLSDLALIHLNSNRFCGNIPTSFNNLKLLYELDVSNNLLAGPFPNVVLQLPCLKYLDIRYNAFQGVLPKEIFDMDLDALFLNNNKFCDEIPQNIGNSKVSVVVLANNELKGCLPPSIGNMCNTIREINLANNGFYGCLPSELGRLTNATVLDVSNNSFSGPMPSCLKEMKGLEVIDVSHNRLTGAVPNKVCELSKLKNVSIVDNFFDGLGESCKVAVMSKGLALDETRNCFFGVSNQKDDNECKEVLSKAIDCGKSDCDEPSAPPPPPPVYSLPPPTPLYSPPEARGWKWSFFRNRDFGWHFGFH